jgi:hypothetical protein
VTHDAEPKQELSAEELEVREHGHLDDKVLFRWHVAVDALKWVVPLMLVKGLLAYFGEPTIELNALLTSIIGGSIFVLGFILAGTLADYKEAERIPAEVASAIESLLEDGKYAAATVQGFDLPAYARAVGGIPQAITDDLRTGGRTLLEATSAVMPFLISMEALGVPANHVVRLKGELASIRTRMLRVYHMQRTNFLPSAYLFVQTLVVIVCALLLATNIEPWYVAMIQTGVVSYVLIYMLRLIRHMETPFRVNELTDDDVSLFLLREAQERAEKIARENPGSDNAS